MYPLSVSPAAPNGRCTTPREAPCPGSPEGQEAGPPRVIQLMPSTIMNPLLLSPSRSVGGPALDFRHSRGGPQVALENGREGKVHSHHHQIPLSQQQQQQQHLLQQQEEALYRNHVIMPVSPPEEQQIPIGRIAGQNHTLKSFSLSSTRLSVFIYLTLLSPQTAGCCGTTSTSSCQTAGTRITSAGRILRAKFSASWTLMVSLDSGATTR